jgi:hypothetical protein
MTDAIVVMCPALDDFVIDLTTTNGIANDENTKRLLELTHSKFSFEADIKDEYPKEKYPTSMDP